MKKFSTIPNLLISYSNKQIQLWSNELLQLLQSLISNESNHIVKYIEHLRLLNEGISNKELAYKVLRRKTYKACGIGTIMSIGGLITLPITLPTDLYITFKIQARMVLSIAYIYGWDINDEQISTDILLVIGGASTISSLKNFGIKIGNEYAKKSVNKFINREIMKKINKVISRKIITKAGKKSLTSFTKLIPLVAAPIGGSINLFGTNTIGKTAILFYSGN